MINVQTDLVEVQGRVRVKVTIRDGAGDGPVLGADLVDPFNEMQRRKAATRLAGRDGEPGTPERIEQLILQCVERLRVKEEADGEPDLDVAGPMTVVRPELIVTRDVVGVSVAEVGIKDGDVVGRWKLYLR